MDNALTSILRSTEQPVLMDASGMAELLEEQSSRRNEKLGDDRCRWLIRRTVASLT